MVGAVPEIVRNAKAASAAGYSNLVEEIALAVEVPREGLIAYNPLLHSNLPGMLVKW